jgi:hypothetical protein
MIEGSSPAVEAFRAVCERDAGGAEVRRILDVIPTEFLLGVEVSAVRLIWAARDIRHARETRSSPGAT